MSRETKWKKLISKLRRKLSDAKNQENYINARKRHPRGAFKLLMELCAIKVRMDGNKNHKRPHIHCDIGTEHHVASIAIDDGKCLAGKLAPKTLKIVQDWIDENRAQLLAIWNDMHSSGRNVDPLIYELKRREWTPRRKGKELAYYNEEKPRPLK